MREKRHEPRPYIEKEKGYELKPLLNIGRKKKKKKKKPTEQNKSELLNAIHNNQFVVISY